MSGRIALITGANSGIGLVTAERLAVMGSEVILVCRDPGRGRAALDRVAVVATEAQPRLLVADLSRRADVRRLAQEADGQLERLDVLVNNAGAVFSRREFTVDGVEKTLATNHLAPFLLTCLLLPLLRRSSAARIVTVASRVHAGAIDFDNLQGERGYSAMKAYGQSKLENILFTYELARRLGSGTVTANCLAPGLVASNFGRNAGGLLGLLPRVLKAVGLAISPEEGARTSVYLASSPEVDGISGRYFYKCEAAQSKPVSYDEAIAARLWRTSLELTGLASSDRPLDSAFVEGRG